MVSQIKHQLSKHIKYQLIGPKCGATIKTLQTSMSETKHDKYQLTECSATNERSINNEHEINE